MTIVHSAVYRDGRRIASPGTLEETLRVLGGPPSGDPPADGAFTWIGLLRPDEEELEQLRERFDLHRLAIEDTVSAHQRPKVECYGRTLFTVLRPAAYADEQEEIRFGEVHVFLGPGFVITVRHADTDGVAKARERLASDPELLRLGPAAVLYAVLDQMVDDYVPTLDGVSTDIDQIEDDLFAGHPHVSPRIYHLARQVTAFHRAVEPLSEMIERAGGSELVGDDEELGHLLRDVHDHALGVTHRVEAFRSSLNDAMQLDGTLAAGRQNDVAVQLNEQTKKISSWAAILVAPTLIAGIYGMNFEHMPELGWAVGYPFSLGLMLVSSAALYLLFKRRGWL